MSAERPYSYDEIIYPSRAVWYMHPRRLATQARLLDLEAPPIRTCRVLELGAATGGNLLPMAAHLPDASFTGLELAARQVEEGRELAAELGLENLEMIQGDIAGIREPDGPELGEYDYILCHGVYSWVSSDVQKAILRTVRDHLAPNGLAAVSYNVLPGWNSKAALHRLLQLTDDPSLPAAERIDRAVLELRDLQTFVDKRKDLPSGLIKAELARFNDMDRSYFFHEFLESHNQPIYFDEFVARAEKADLGYIANLLGNNGRHAHWLAEESEATELDRERESNIVREEALRDIRLFRQFRATMLGHRTREPSRAVQPERIYELGLSMRVDDRNLTVDMVADGPITIVDPDGNPHVLRNGLERVARVLLDASPASVSFASLFELVANDDSWTKEEVAARLLKLYFGYALELNCDPPAVAVEPGKHPRCHELTRLEARRDEWVTNAWHIRIKVNTLHRVILQYLDGEHDIEGIAAEIRDRIESGDLKPKMGNPTPDEIVSVIPEALDQFAKLAMLIPNPPTSDEPA